MKTRAHTRYRDSAGAIVPGTTTITGQLNKPGLVRWANNLGLQGIDSTKHVDDKAAIGTLAHHLIETFLTGGEPDLDDYTKRQIKQAEVPYKKFLEWFEDNAVEVILTEQQIVSDRYKFGGTIDLYCRIGKRRVLVDHKTSGGIYPEMLYQAAAYKELLKEAGHPVDEVRILRIGRDEAEGFEERRLRDTRQYWKIFKLLRELYSLRSQ